MQKKKTNKYLLLDSQEVYDMYGWILKGYNNVDVLKKSTGKKKSAVFQIIQPLKEAGLVKYVKGTGTKGNPAEIYCTEEGYIKFLENNVGAIQIEPYFESSIPGALPNKISFIKPYKIVSEAKKNVKAHLENLKPALSSCKTFRGLVDYISKGCPESLYFDFEIVIKKENEINK